jgi:protein TonB
MPADAPVIARGAPRPAGRAKVYLACFALALIAHWGLGHAFKGMLTQPVEFAMEEAAPSVEVNLVEAPAPQETVVPPAPVPEEPVAEIPMPPPPPEPQPEPEPESESEPIVAPKEEIKPQLLPEPLPEPKQEPPPTPRPRPEPQPQPQPEKPKSEASSRPRNEKPTRQSRDSTGSSPQGRTPEPPAKPAYLKNPQPPYPEAARRAGQEGTVYVKVIVDKSGRVSSASVTRSSGHPTLDQQAVSTIRRQWRFKPARSAGVAIESEVVIPIVFKID